MKVDLSKHKSDILVVHCSDPRFQAAYRELIDGLGKYYDLVVAPGASKAIASNKSVLDYIVLLHSLHHFEEVYIFDHVECGAFGEIEDERTNHGQTMIKAAGILRAAIPGIKVYGRLVGQTRASSLKT